MGRHHSGVADGTGKVARYMEFRMSANRPAHETSSGGVICGFIHKGVCFNTKPVEISYDLMVSNKVRVWRMAAALAHSGSPHKKYRHAAERAAGEDVTDQWLQLASSSSTSS